MSIRPDAAVALQPTLERLAQLAQLGPDWDSYGGVPPSAQSIATARRLLLTVAEQCGDAAGNRVRPYAVVPMAQGGVQLEWRSPLREVEVEVGPHGNIGYLLVERQGTERRFEEGDEISWQHVLDLIALVLTPPTPG